MDLGVAGRNFVIVGGTTGMGFAAAVPSASVSTRQRAVTAWSAPLRWPPITWGLCAAWRSPQAP